MQNPKIITISGPSGAGKNSVADPLHQMSDQFVFLVTCTTREKRPNEEDGRDYYFLGRKEFDDLIENDGLFEWEQVFDHKYGSRKSDVEKLLQSGKVVVAVIDVKGALKLKVLYPDTLTIFIAPPSQKDASNRLAERGTEDKESTKTRQERYDFEMSQRDKFDHIIINDNLKIAQRELLDIIQKLFDNRGDDGLI